MDTSNNIITDKESQANVNPAKFEIICDKEHSRIVIKNKKDEVEISLQDRLTSLTASIVRYSKAPKGKILQTTDINGFVSQTVLDISEMPKESPIFNDDFQYGIDYLYVVSVFKNKDREEQILPLFVKIPEELYEGIDPDEDEEEIEEIPAPEVTVFEGKKKNSEEPESYVVIGGDEQKG